MDIALLRVIHAQPLIHIGLYICAYAMYIVRADMGPRIAGPAALIAGRAPCHDALEAKVPTTLLSYSVKEVHLAGAPVEYLS